MTYADLLGKDPREILVAAGVVPDVTPLADGITLVLRWLVIEAVKAHFTEVGQ